MTILTGTFTDWSRKPKSTLKTFNHASPNLRLIGAELERRFGCKSVGDYGVRRIRGGRSYSVHSWGAAQDRSFRGLPNWEQRKREACRWLVENSAELGVQAVHDYSGDGLTGNGDRGYIWRSNRSVKGDPTKGWKKQRKSRSGMGQVWSDWLHLEVTEASWSDTTPIADRLGETTSTPTAEPKLRLPRPTVRSGTRNAEARVLQQHLKVWHEAGRVDDPGPIDGWAGRRTIESLKDFQVLLGVFPDGVYGPQTLAAHQRLEQFLAGLSAAS